MEQEDGHMGLSIQCEVWPFCYVVTPTRSIHHGMARIENDLASWCNQPLSPATRLEALWVQEQSRHGWEEEAMSRPNSMDSQLPKLTQLPTFLKVEPASNRDWLWDPDMALFAPGTKLTKLSSYLPGRHMVHSHKTHSFWVWICFSSLQNLSLQDYPGTYRMPDL